MRSKVLSSQELAEQEHIPTIYISEEEDFKAGPLLESEEQDETTLRT